MLAALDAAPEDDEPVTAADLAAIAEARHDLAAGRVRPIDDAFRDLDEIES